MLVFFRVRFNFTRDVIRVTGRYWCVQCAALQRELEDLRRAKEERERELEAENNEFKMEIVKLRAEMEAILRELQSIMDSKLGLELEIAAYRKLLEGEETRLASRACTDFPVILS